MYYLCELITTCNMTSRIRHITLWSALFLLTLLSASSCGKKFSILEYQLNVLSVNAGYWDNGSIIRYPSVEVRVEGPDSQDWEIIVSPANGAMPYTEPAVTGRSRTITLEGIDLNADQREIGLTIQAIHVNTGEVLATYKQYKATLEGNFAPPAPPETIFVTSLSMVIEQETSSISVTDGHRATMDVLEHYSGSLLLSYNKEETETDPISCTLSQTGESSLITLSEEGIIQEDSSFTIPFTSGEPGTGSFSIILKGKGPETVLVVSYIVKTRPYEATFTPNHFTFASQYDAHGTVNAFGFREGEKCDVILNWKETTTGNEGSTRYEGVDAKTPLDVILWKAGEAAVGQDYIFWAQVYEEGETEPVATTEEQSVSPFALTYAWTDAHGDSTAPGNAVRSWASSSICQFDVVTASWAPEFIKMITIKDVTAGRSYSSQEPVADTEGFYRTEMKHPKRGVHNFTVTLETEEGNFTFETEMTFIDVWTVSPYAKGSSLYLILTGPVSSLKTDCNMSITLHGYALWDYTLAETNESGQKVNTPQQAKVYIGSRTEPFTIENGTSSGSHIKVKPIAGLFNIAMRMLKDKCSGKPFSMTGITATRWNGDTATSYTPDASSTFVRFDIAADDPFYEDFNEVYTDISQLKSTLSDNGIYF